MGLFDYFTKRKLEPVQEQRNRVYYGNQNYFFQQLTGQLIVTEESILANPTIYACIRILSNSVASLPLKLYRTQQDGSRKQEAVLGFDNLIIDQPNPAMNGVEFLSSMMFNLLMYNVAYAEILRDASGYPVEVWPIPPQNITLVETTSGGFYYTILNTSGKQKIVNFEDILRVTGTSKISPTSQLVPLAPINFAKEALGLSLSSDQHAATALKNGTGIQGVLECPTVLTDEGFQRLKQDWENTYQGSANSGRTAILEAGVTFNPIAVDAEKLQLLETRKYQVRDIARIFGVPTHMLNDPERQSFNSNEQQGLDFVTYTLRPWLVRIEKALATAFLTPTQRKSVYFEFDTKALLRGDIATRYNSYQIGIQNGWLSADEVRIMENLEPIEGDVGNQYLLPMNMQSAQGKKDMEAAQLEKLKADTESVKKKSTEPSNLDKPEPKAPQDTASNMSRNLVEQLLEHALTEIDQRANVALSNIKEKATSVEDFSDKILTFAKGHKKFIEGRLQSFVELELADKSLVGELLNKRLSAYREKLETKDITLEQLKGIN
jgi:HK97 family phage portal protein